LTNGLGTRDPAPRAGARLPLVLWNTPKDTEAPLLGACEASVMHQSREFRLTRLPLMRFSFVGPGFRDREGLEGVHSVALDHSIVAGNTIVNNAGGALLWDETLDGPLQSYWLIPLSESHLRFILKSWPRCPGRTACRSSRASTDGHSA
jgi:hypothetical protein